MANRLSSKVLACSLVVLVTACLYALSRVPSRQNVHQAPKSEYGLLEYKHDLLGSKGEGSDIIFVHGLGSNPDTTWGTIETGRQRELRSHATNNWITEFLPTDIATEFEQSTRIFFYNYDSYWLRDALHTNLEHICEDFMAAISNLRKHNDVQRNIILVTHSYGGLVVKRALVKAFLAKTRGYNALDPVKATIFLGCPHRGSSFAHFGKMQAKILRLFGSNLAILDGLEYDSLDLLHLHNEYVQIAERSEIQTTNFFEQRGIALFNSLFVTEQSATFSGMSVQNLPLPLSHTGINKFSSRSHSYQQVLHEILRFLRHALPNKLEFFSVPVETVDAYTERHELSATFAHGLAQTARGSALPRAVVVTGLAGIGKTQLVLRFIETHRKDYNTILWIDASNEQLIRSSFKRCAWELGLSAPFSSAEGPLRDDPAILEVKQWLRRRTAPGQEWLFVIDNADDDTLDIRSIIPSGCRGSVVLISTDNWAPELFEGEVVHVKVTNMKDDEASAALLNHFVDKNEKTQHELQVLVDEFKDVLGGLPFAIGFAGASIRVELEQHKGDANLAVQSVLIDYRQHQAEIHNQAGSAGWTQYNKTLWTVWETTLHQMEIRHPNATRILKFLAMFDVSNIQHELFRLAAYGQHSLKSYLTSTVPCNLPADCGIPSEYEGAFFPPWLQDLLQLDVDGRWNDSKFRQVTNLLRRYNMCQPVNGLWKGIQMHSLVHWRIQQEYSEADMWRWYILFISAVTLELRTLSDSVEHITIWFRLAAHLPRPAEISECGFIKGSGSPWKQAECYQILMLLTDIFVYRSSGDVNQLRSQRSISLNKKAVDIAVSTWGPNHRNALYAYLMLAHNMLLESQWEEVEALHFEAIHPTLEAFKERSSYVLLSKCVLASAYAGQGKWESALPTFDAVLRSVAILVQPDTCIEHLQPLLRCLSQYAHTCEQTNRTLMAVKIKVRVVAMASVGHGEKHWMTLASVAGLAELYALHHYCMEAVRLLSAVMNSMIEVFGQTHSLTVQAKTMLTLAYYNLGWHHEAESVALETLYFCDGLVQKCRSTYPTRMDELPQYMQDLTALNNCLMYVGEGSYAQFHLDEGKAAATIHPKASSSATTSD